MADLWQRKENVLLPPEAWGRGRLSADHIHSHKYIHTWASFREIPPVCLSRWNEMRLMKEEEKVTAEGLSLYHCRSQEEKRERQGVGKIVKGVCVWGGTEVSSGHPSNVHQGSNIWFTASPTVSSSWNQTPSSCPAKTLTDKTSQNPSPSVSCVEDFHRQAHIHSVF